MPFRTISDVGFRLRFFIIDRHLLDLAAYMENTLKDSTIPADFSSFSISRDGKLCVGPGRNTFFNIYLTRRKNQSAYSPKYQMKISTNLSQYLKKKNLISYLTCHS